MTDVDGTQVLDPQDEELIRRLVPRRHARWKIAILLMFVATLVAGVVVVEHTGFPAPRLSVWIDSVRAEGDRATVTLHIRNTGKFSGTVESIRLDGGLIDSGSTVRPDVVVKHGHDATVAVRINTAFAFDCNTTFDISQHVAPLRARVKMRNSIGIVTTRIHKVNAVRVATRHGQQPVLGIFDNWPTAATNASCGRYK